MKNFLEGTDAGLFTASLLVFIGILTLIGMYKGARRGFSRQLVRFITVIVSVFISVYLVRLGTAAFMAWVEGQTVEDIIGLADNFGLPMSESFIGQLLSYLDSSTASHVVAIPVALVIAPVCFALCFMMVSGLMLIVHAIVSGIFGFFKRRNNALTRFFGLLLGGVQGVLVSFFVLVPVVGLLCSAADAIDTHKAELAEAGTEASGAVEFYDEYLSPYAENPVVKTAGAMSGRLLYNMVSTVNVNGAKYKMAKTVSSPALNAYIAIESMGEYEWKSVTPENEAAIRDLIAAMCEGDYTEAILADALSSISAAYSDGLITLELPSPLDEVVATAVDIFKDIEPEELEPTLNTAADAYFLLSREGVLVALEHDTDAVVDLLTKKDAEGKTVVNKTIAILKSNARTASVVTAITKISVSAMADKLGTGEDTALIYENVKSGLNETLKINKSDYATDEEYTAAVSSSIDGTLKENGIELEADIVDSMADYVTENFADKDVATDEELDEIILSYYDAYLEYNETGVLPEDVPELN